MVRTLAEGIWQLDFTGVNSYVVDDGGATTLVDGGMPWHSGRLERALERVAGGPATVDRVLVTHYDIDHVGALGRVDGLDAPVYAGEPDAAYIAGTAKPPLASKKGLFQRTVGVGYRSPAGSVSTVADGDSVGGFTCYHTPGHTPGHIVYVHERLSLALLGDVVRSTDGGFEPSPWFLSDDTSAVRRSVRDLAERVPPVEIGAPGHGQPITSNAGERLRQCADEQGR